MPALLHELAADGLKPQVTLTCWWDGIVSQLRAYSVTELQQLAGATGAKDYSWRSGRAPILSTPGYLPYLIGCPDDHDDRDNSASQNIVEPVRTGQSFEAHRPDQTTA